MLTVGSLFAGIGGIDLAFEAAGFRIAWQVEIDDFCTDILSKRWPDVPRYRDVRECGAHNLARCDVLTGGFPCQDISVAGQGAGILAGTRSGLWFEFARIIGELRPRLVLLENVPAITTRDGTVVLGSLAALGYDARWGVISAADAGASHQRERWWCVAHAGRDRSQQSETVGKTVSDEIWHDSDQESQGRSFCSSFSNSQVVADAQYSRCEGRKSDGQRTSTIMPSGSTEGREYAQSRLGGGADGLSAWLDESYSRLHVARPGQLQHEWEPPRVASGQSGRVNRLKALGNAVVPQVVYPIAVMMHKWLEEAD